jgi:hypothetical protein
MARRKVKPMPPMPDLQDLEAMTECLLTQASNAQGKSLREVGVLSEERQRRVVYRREIPMSRLFRRKDAEE